MNNFIPLSRKTRIARHLGALGAAALAWSCAATDGADPPSRDDSPIASTGGASGGSSGPQITIGGSLSLPGENGAGSGATATCHAQVREGQRVPIDMYLLVDSSGSMAERVGGAGPLPESELFQLGFVIPLHV